jgi:hypothetical protein
VGAATVVATAAAMSAVPDLSRVKLEAGIQLVSLTPGHSCLPNGVPILSPTIVSDPGPWLNTD